MLINIFLLLFLMGFSSNQSFQLLRPYCSIAELCVQDTGFVVISSHNKSVVIVHDRDEISKMCISVHDGPRRSLQSSFHCVKTSSGVLAFNQLIFNVSSSADVELSTEKVYEMEFYQVSESSGMSKYLNKPVVFQPLQLHSSLDLHHRQIGLRTPLMGMLLSRELAIEFFSTPTFAAVLDVDIKGILRVQLPSDIDHFATAGITEIEPASWFFTITPYIRHNTSYDNDEILSHNAADATQSSESPKEELIPSIPTVGYVEVILSDADIAQERHFPSTRAKEYHANRLTVPPVTTEEQRGDSTKPSVTTSLEQELLAHFQKRQYHRQLSQQEVDATTTLYAQSFPAKKSTETIRVCIASGTKMDGQKRIWIDQMRYLTNQTKLEALGLDSRFQFDFVYLFSVLNTMTAEEYQPDDSHGTTSKPTSSQVPLSFDDMRATALHAALTQPNSALYYLKDISGVMLVEKPNFATSRKELAEVPQHEDLQRLRRRSPPDEGSDVSQLNVNLAASDVWAGNSTLLFEYMHARFELADGNVTRITPSWCQRFYQEYYDLLKGSACDLLVYGNARAFNSDVFLTDITRTLQIPSLTELLNLFLDERILPDVLIAPSQYALQHHSVQGPMRSQLTASGFQPVGVVIQPSVDMNHFDPVRTQHALQQQIPSPPSEKRNAHVVHQRPLTSTCPSFSRDPTYEHQTQRWRNRPKHFPCILIGFVGRLDAEKNPGLFLQTAHHLYYTLQQKQVRFRLIGDGAVRSQLQQLSVRLQIAHLVDFVGWVSSADLPAYISDLDLVVNPSLRAWSETFCIANLEVMAMNVPLVTFAVGGKSAGVLSVAF